MSIRYQLNQDKLRDAVKRMGFTSVAEFCLKFKINRTTLNRYYQGMGPITDSFYEICTALNEDPLQLLNRVTEATSLADWSEIRHIVHQVVEHYPHLAVGLIGSRARGNAKPYSDWDLAITGGALPVAPAEYFAIKELVAELAEDLPRSVDVVCLDDAPAWFIEEMDYEPRFLLGDEKNWNFFLGMKYGIQKKQKTRRSTGQSQKIAQTCR